MTEATFHAQGEDPVEILYICGKCQAEDRDRGVNPPAPQVLNCWNCGERDGMSRAHEVVN
jgi:DNA-directed RNA polymerase subunit RPC12/RpoP